MIKVGRVQNIASLLNNRFDANLIVGYYNVNPVAGTITAISYLDLGEIAAPATPGSGYGRLHADANGSLYYKNDAGLDREISTYDPYYLTVTLQDDFVTSSISAYWTGWSTTPGGTISYNLQGHLLQAVTSSGQSGTTCFLYKTQNVGNGNGTEAIIGVDSQNVEAGIRWDDGSDNNYVEVVVKGGVGTYSALDLFIETRTREGGGAVTTTQISSPMPGGKLFRLKMVQSTTTQFYIYVAQDVQTGFTTGYSAGSARAYTRHGIFVRATAASARAIYCHRYGASF